MKKLFVFFLFLLIFGGCNYDKTKSKEVVKSFFDFVKKEDIRQMIDLYPAIDSLKSGGYCKSDSILIHNVSREKDSLIIVECTNVFTNHFGKRFDTSIVMYVRQLSKDKYIILDSKGFFSYKDDPLYSFALKTGCITNKDITDVEIGKKLITANGLLFSLIYDVYSELRYGVTVSTWSWETNDWTDSAHGRGIVKNSTSYSISGLKYIITYKNRKGQEITTDEGYVSYDKIAPWSSKSFSFYSGYVGNAVYASIDLEFDFTKIEEYVLSKNYSGNEYSTYIKSKSDFVDTAVDTCIIDENVITDSLVVEEVITVDSGAVVAF